MNKNELKKILRPLIKECIKEVIFEEGTLSTIISEVVKGTASAQIMVSETLKPTNQKRSISHAETARAEQKRKQLNSKLRRNWGVNL